MDMGRTCVNLIGNCLATIFVARWEGEFDDNAHACLARRPKQNWVFSAAILPLQM
jgi:Na+/H+-dicarboxylate symporter